eukprot:5030839-Pleurochrysis_carterae.AAC.1
MPPVPRSPLAAARGGRGRDSSGATMLRRLRRRSPPGARAPTGRRLRGRPVPRRRRSPRGRCASA